MNYVLFGIVVFTLTLAIIGLAFLLVAFGAEVTNLLISFFSSHQRIYDWVKYVLGIRSPSREVLKAWDKEEWDEFTKSLGVSND